jgi:phosphomannomutase/phosphoglucomutase
VVDAKGNLILADQQMMLYAKDVLKLIPGAKIIYDAMSSNTLAADIIKNGGKPILTNAKHAHSNRTWRKEGAELAGEMTGNFYFKDRWFGFDDALYSAARLLEIVSHKDAPTTDVFAELPSREHNEYYTIPMSAEDAVKFVTKLAEVAIFPEGKVTSIDCLRVDFKDGLGVAVPSQLTAAVEFRFEADNEEALARIKNGFKQFMVVSKPGMKIPF